MLRILCLGFALLFAGIAAADVADVYDFEDRAEEQRYQNLISELRCPKCQNQNLAGSDAPIAEDLRGEVHRLIRSGSSDQEILQHMLDRYGDFVLYRPRFTLETLALWLGPLVLVLIGLGIWWRLSRADGAKAVAPSLSEDEQKILDKVLEQRGD